MAQDITLSMDGMLLNWLKDAGDTVKKGEVIAEFEADKATVEVEATADGVLSELLIEVGDEISEGTVIARIGDGGAAPAQEEDPAQEAAPEAPAQAAPAEEAPAEEAAPAAATPAARENGAATTPDGRIKASPLARRIAEEKGVDLAQLSGSGPGGRIVKADVERYEPGAAPAAAPSAPSAPATKPSAPVAAPGGLTSYGKLPTGDDVEVVDIPRMRRLIAEGTIRSFSTTPHFYVTVEVDVEPLLALRKEINDMLTEEGIKVSVNDMLVKAVALSLRAYPNLNNHYYGDKIVRNKRVNVAIAVALPDNGLANLVSPDADSSALATMASYHKQMFEDARNGKIKPEYVRGGTFLVSNLGPYDVESFSAIIDPPMAGALAVGAAQRVPIVKEDGTLGVGSRMKMTLSIDHRVSDGAEGAQFLRHLRGLIENPMRLLV